MSKSLKRVQRALVEAGADCEIMEMQAETRTADDAAREVGCEIDQIAKSIIFKGNPSGKIILFITAGGNQISSDKAADLAGEKLCRADAAYIRSVSGFAIGGVAPIGHVTPPKVFMDLRLMEFTTVYAAGGTPRHIFGICPVLLAKSSGAVSTRFSA